MREGGLRVVVTGLGAISPIGVGASGFWEALLAGKNGLGPLQGVDTSKYRTHCGGQVLGFDAASYLPAGSEQFLHPQAVASRFAIAASRMALDHARLEVSRLPPRSVGVALGTTVGETQIIEAVDQAWVERGPGDSTAALVRHYPGGEVPLNVARAFKLKGPNTMVPTACAAGNYAIGFGCDAIREGRCRVMLVGGSDPFSMIAFAGFNRLIACAPERVQPFDRNRKGMMVSEGAGMLVLEELEHAVERKAEIIAELLGYGLSCDAHHMTQPQQDGQGASTATLRALSATGVAAEQVDYFCAHGTGTPANDRIETLAIKHVFGAHAARLPVSSIKSMLGHCMGAASALEAVATALVVQRDVLPPTINYDTPDPDCDLDYVPNHAREHRVRVAVSNAYGFGGNNASIVLAKWEA